MSGRPANTPDRTVVERIARQEAERFGVSFDSVIGVGNGPTIVEARHAAMRRLVDETGCSLIGLCWAWGCGRDAARRALGAKPLKKNFSTKRGAVPAPAPAPTASAYDTPTVRRLAEIHPLERVAAIIAGRDPATNQDIAAWRQLGCRSGADLLFVESFGHGLD